MLNRVARLRPTARAPRPGSLPPERVATVTGGAPRTART